MKKQEISLSPKQTGDVLIHNNKTLCTKCGGSGNLKTPENSRRTCLSCFGRGFIIEDFHKD